MARRIDSILAQARGDKTKWAVEVVSLDTGDTLYQKNPHQLMIPASNIKLFTTAAALYYLGPGFTTRTSFYYDGPVSAEGVLKGNLIVYGRGDPNISGRFTDKPTTIFEQAAASLKSLGLRQVQGDVIGDDSYFDAQYYGPWSPEHSRKWYAARVSALSFNDNCTDLCVSPSKPGQKARISQAPWTSYPRVINNASTTSSKNGSVWISPGGDGSAVVVSGKIWSRKKAEVLFFPVESPSLYAATVFKETLARSGIKVSGKARALDASHKSAVPRGALPVYEYESLPLSEMIKVVNKRSQNLHAELILKQVGYQSRFGPTFEGGASAVENFVGAANIDRDSVIICDGSGLSTQNRASAHSFVQLLRFMDTSAWSEPFRESLAIVGTDRTVRSLAPVVPHGSILAKTGSLKNAISLSGYADGKTERLAFSIIANDFKGDQFRIKQIRNKICKELVNY
ncbi:D-alanyl-D-alanine carboxypeptidase/D-alanyl-D-alanine-endopeptidase [Candidatus Poribacteria bacterium]|nr:D-alanyl-D-alanine carboxypeptidase/D-alanyl-D-alanine-endopeptidase [Candidatus Poribacteria bacterium]